MPASDEFDLFPSLNAAFHKRLTSSLEKKFGLRADFITLEALDHLKPALAAYKQEAECLRGFLNKGGIRLLGRVSAAAYKLSREIEEARGAGYDLLISEAASSLQIEVLMETLAELKERLEITPRDTPFIADTSRERLFERFESWWCKYTKTTPQIEEGMAEDPHPTPFMFVANEVFNLPGMPPPTGTSYASLKKMRRGVKARADRLRGIGAALSKLADQNPTSDQG